MASIRAGAAWEQIRRLFGTGAVAGLTEWDLLRRYVERRDESAFAALVSLHGGMVVGTCRRLLDDPEDVEDAFQATFLVLARRAGALRPQDAVGPWLYGVARRVALRARSEASRRRSRERPVADVGELTEMAEPTPPAHDPELAPLLDRELAGLPASYRAAIVLCYLEGRTHEEAARQLGWPVGTVKGRLARARELLRGRLARRGLVSTTAGLAATISREASATAPTTWVPSTIKAAMRVAAGEATAGVISTSAVALAEGVLRAMKIQLLKTAVVSLGLLVTVAVGAGAFAQRVNPPVEGEPRKKANEAAPPAADPPKDAMSRTILAQLEERVAMNFPNETPLEDVLKYVRQVTQNEKLGLPTGIPIYVDPAGLQDAEKTTASPIALDLEGLPLRLTLTLALKQIGLYYYVDQGLMVITSSNSDDLTARITSPVAPSPLLLLREKAERGEMTPAERKAFIETLKDLKEIRSLLHELDNPEPHGHAPHRPAEATPAPKPAAKA